MLVKTVKMKTRICLYMGRFFKQFISFVFQLWTGNSMKTPVIVRKIHKNTMNLNAWLSSGECSPGELV